MARQRTIKINITGDASGATASLSGLDSVFGSIQKRFVQLLGVAGLFAVIRGLQRAGKAAIELSKNFERSMSTIVGLVGISRDQVADWKDDIKSLAPETGRSMQELGDALFFITSAGLRGSAAIDTLEASAKAAAAGLGETRTVADAATSAMNAYGESNLSAEQAVDILVATVREGKIAPEELAQVVGRLLPLSAELGIEFHEVGAALAAMSRLGLDAATASTSLRGIFSALIKPTQEGSKELERLGTSFGELRQQVRDEGLLPTLLELRDRFGDNDEAITRVFGNVRALTGVLNLVGENSEAAEQIFANMTETTGDLDDAFAAAAETSGFKLEQAMGRLQVIGLEFGDDVLPRIIDSVEQMLPALEEILPALGEFVTAMLTFANSILPVVTPLMVTTGDVFKGFGIILNDIVGIWDENAAAANRYIEAQLNVERAVEDGEDVVDALANSLFHLIANGELTSSKFRGLAADANLTDAELDAVRETLIAENAELLKNQQRIESLQKMHRLWIDHGIKPSNEELAALGVEVGEGQVAINVLENALLSADAVLAENTISTAELAKIMGADFTPEVEDADRAMLGHAAAMRDGADAADEAQDPTEDLTDDVGDLRDRLDEAREAQENLSDVLKAAASPVFNAIDALDNYQSVLDDVEDQSNLTKEEQIKLLEAGLEVASAFEDLDPQTALDALSAIAEANGTTEDSVRDLLAEFGILIDESGNIGTSFEDGVLSSFAGMGDRLANKVSEEARIARNKIKLTEGIESPSTVWAEEIGLPISEGIAEGILEGMESAESAVEDLLKKVRNQAETDLNDIFDSISAISSKRGAERRLERAKADLAALEAEKKNLPAAIAAAKANIQAAESEDARKDAVEELNKLLERKSTIDKDLAVAEDDVLGAQLRLIESQKRLVESGKELVGNTAASRDAFIALAEQAGLTREEIDKLIATSTRAFEAGQDAVFPPTVPGGSFPGLNSKEIDELLEGSDNLEAIAERIRLIFRNRNLALREDRLSRIVREVSQGRTFDSIREALEPFAAAHGGIATDPILSLIGEAGSDEAIIPLNQRGISVLAEALKVAIGDIAPQQQTVEQTPNQRGLLDGANIVLQGTPESMLDELGRRIGFEIRWATG